MGSLLLVLALAAPGEVVWEDWSDAAFARAKAEHRLVLLDVGAVWCHWCHVMDETTYTDPRVVRLLGEHFVAVRVDQDARPDLANRYEDYGWPATVVFDAAGNELSKFQGYIAPPRMASLLEALVEDPTPGPSVTEPLARRGTGAPLSRTELRESLRKLLAVRWDEEHGGWGFVHKFLDWDNAESSFERGLRGDETAAGRALAALATQARLLDPVWGGVYQYSDSGDWDHPHFEKILSMQAENLRLYAIAYARTYEKAHLDMALAIHRYLDAFLRSPDGAYYVSQDADLVPGQHSADYFAQDDAGRRAQGVPRVDTHLYARETAWAAHALVELHRATGDARFLAQAETAARWVQRERALPGGGFRHDAKDPGGPYLGDTVAAARAFLALHLATGDRTWLDATRAALDFAEARFRADDGYATAVPATPQDRPAPQRDENAWLTRVAAAAYETTRDARHLAMAEHALAYLSRDDVARAGSPGTILLALDAVEKAAVRGATHDEAARRAAESTADLTAAAAASAPAAGVRGAEHGGSVSAARRTPEHGPRRDEAARRAAESVRGPCLQQR